MLASRFQVLYIWLWLSILFACGTVLAGQLLDKPSLETGLAELVPDSTADPWEELAEKNRTSEFERRTIWVLVGENRRSLEEFTRRVDQALQQSGFFAEESTSEGEQIWKLQFENLHQSRGQLLSDTDRELLSRGAATYLAQYRKLLFSPLGGAYLASIETDPAGLFTRYFQSLIPHGALEVLPDNGLTVFRTRELKPDQLGFSRIVHLRELHRELRNEAREYDVHLYATGAPLYTAYAVASAQREMTYVGSISLLLIILLCGVIFRSARPLGLTLLAVLTGFLGGFSTTLYLHGSVHILTLVFGATVIGIGADYSFHFLVHSHNRLERRGTSSYVFRSLLLGLTSSVAAFLMLLLLPFPWLQQIGLFMASGLALCCLTVFALFPIGLGQGSTALKVPQILIPKRSERKVYLRYIAGLLIASTPGLLMLEPNDRVSDLYERPHVLQEDEQAIIRAMNNRPETRYLLVKESTEEKLLRAEERVIPALKNLVEKRDLAGFSAVAQRYPSRQRRLENAALQQNLYQSMEFSRFLSELGHPGVPQEESRELPPRHRKPSPIFGGSDFLGCSESTCASVITLTGINSLEALREAIEVHSEVRIVDRIGAINQLLGTFRSQLEYALALVGAIIFILLATILGFRAAVQIILLPFAACIGAMAAVGYLNQEYSLVNLLALLLLMGLSLDYAIFRTLAPEAAHSATSLAIGISVLTSLIAFGLLGFSETTAISQFGVTIGFGLIIACLLSSKMNSLSEKTEVLPPELPREPRPLRR